jgi:hypothetical protein
VGGALVGHGGEPVDALPGEQYPGDLFAEFGLVQIDRAATAERSEGKERNEEGGETSHACDFMIVNDPCDDQS